MFDFCSGQNQNLTSLVTGESLTLQEPPPNRPQFALQPSGKAQPYTGSVSLTERHAQIVHEMVHTMSTVLFTLVP